MNEKNSQLSNQRMVGEWLENSSKKNDLRMSADERFNMSR